MKNKLLTIAIYIIAGILQISYLYSQPPKNCVFVYFGTAINEAGKGFSMATFDTITGILAVPKFINEAASPSYFVIDKSGKYLYSVNETELFQNSATGAISSYSINGENGNLTLLNQKPSGGKSPCFISIDKTGNYILTANYNGGNISVYALESNGFIGNQTGFNQHYGKSINPSRQTSAFAHCIKSDPTNHFILATNLGVDKVYIYQFNSTNGTITANKPAFASLPAGSGPRHLSFHSSGKWLYVVNELSCTVTVFDWDNKKGTLTEKQTISTLPADYNEPNTCAEISVYPNGKYLYVSNRGHNSIAQFNINQQNGKLTFVECVSSQGNKPRNFIFDPSNKWMIVTNHDSNNALVLNINPLNGKLSYTGNTVPVPYPFGIAILK